MEVKNLPDKLRIFVLNGATRNIAPGVTLSATVVLKITSRVYTQVEGEVTTRNIHLGVLATDHAGYISFDLRPLKKFNALIERMDVLNTKIEIRLETDEIFVESPFQTNFRHQLLPSLFDSPVGSSSGQFADYLPSSIPILLPSDINFLSNPSLSGIQSIPNPDVMDWKTSPESFGMAGLPTIGEDGCETLLPSQSTDRIFRFHQLARFPSIENEILNSGQENLEFRRGKLIEYEMLWHPINHGLGQVQYSLTLAPGEETKIAVIEWDRKDESVRSERTGLSESLLHEQKRNRIIDEAVEATIKEYQRGKSFMGGTAGVGGYGGQGQGSMWGVTGSHSVGYAETSSEGSRNLESQSAQQLGDTIAQASSMMRDLRSTVIVQANQSEREVLQTRSIRNYNHSHALTILYYEVVRHYCITTRAAKEQEVVFVKYNNQEFSIARVKKYQRILQDSLIDKNLLENFNLINYRLDVEEERINTLIFGVIKKFIVRATQGSDPLGAAFERLRLLILTKNGDVLFAPFRSAGPHFSGDSINAAFITFTFTIDEEDNPLIAANLKLDDIVEIGLVFNVVGDFGGQERFGFKKLEIKAVVEREMNKKLVTLSEFSDIPSGENSRFEQDSEWWSFPNRIPNIPSEYADYLLKKNKIDDLLSHLNSNLHYYNSIIWLSENPNDRLNHFENFQYSTSGLTPMSGRLSDFINPQPIDIFGNYVAFRLGEVKSIPEEEIELSEQIVSMPTRGLFAEAQLSHCNASEIIDDTRFWDWQISPIPDSAPEISGVSPTSRYRDIIGNPTGLPNNSIGVENAPDAPAPSALSQIIDSITKSEIFRDMSAKAELASILNELTKAAAEVEKQRMQSITELGKQDAETERARMQAESNRRQSGSTESPSSGSGSSSGGGSEPTSSPTTIPQSTSGSSDVPSARDTSTDIAAIRREVTDPQEQQARVEGVLDRRTRTGGSSRRITIDLKYGTQDLAGQFSVVCTNRSTSRGTDTDEINNRREDTSTPSSSLTVRIPSSWTTIRVAVRIQSLTFLNHSLLDANADFRALIQARSTSGSIFNLNIPDSGNRLYEYVTPLSISEVVSIQDTLSRSLVCNFRILTDEIQVERTESAGQEDQWNFSGNLGYEGNIVLGISGGNSTTTTRGESTVVRRTLRVRYIDPSQPVITQGSEGVSGE